MSIDVEQSGQPAPVRKDLRAADPDRVTAGVTATLPEGSLRELIIARVVTGFIARGDAGGFVIEANLGTEPGRIALLGNTRGGPRVFASLGTVAVLLQRMGFTQFSVDSSNYVPGRVRAPRPDRSAAMKKTATVSERVVAPSTTGKTKPSKKKLLKG